MRDQVLVNLVLMIQLERWHIEAYPINAALALLFLVSIILASRSRVERSKRLAVSIILAILAVPAMLSSFGVMLGQDIEGPYVLIIPTMILSALLTVVHIFRMIRTREPRGEAASGGPSEP